jgi:hypothetical protein
MPALRIPRQPPRDGAGPTNEFERSEQIIDRIRTASHEQEIYVTSTDADAFTLKNSNLNAFLYADVGTELNGSALTILSVLSRLGNDPWAEAARWTAMPKAAMIDCLARSIGKMPLDPQALADTNAIATRLVLLLPMQTQPPGQGIREAVKSPAMPNWMPVAFFCASLLMSLAFSMRSTPVSSDASPTPITRTIDPPSAK